MTNNIFAILFLLVDISLECLSTWRQPDKTLVLVRNLNYESGPIGCVVSKLNSFPNDSFHKCLQLNIQMYKGAEVQGESWPGCPILLLIQS